MAYEGELMLACPADMFDFAKANAVIVSGMWCNRFGHMLLNTGGVGGMYFQTAGAWTEPRFMDEAQFQKYLADNDKKVLKRFSLRIPHPEKSQLKLEQLLAERYKWGIVVHNCETLVEEIIVAGGGPHLHDGVLSLPTRSKPSN